MIRFRAIIAVFFLCVGGAVAQAETGPIEHDAASMPAKRALIGDGPPAKSLPSEATSPAAHETDDGERNAGHFDHRCRVVTDYAQLGEYLPGAIELLRRSCG